MDKKELVENNNPNYNYSRYHIIILYKEAIRDQGDSRLCFRKIGGYDVKRRGRI